MCNGEDNLLISGTGSGTAVVGGTVMIKRKKTAENSLLISKHSEYDHHMASCIMHSTGSGAWRDCFKIYFSFMLLIV